MPGCHAVAISSGSSDVDYFDITQTIDLGFVPDTITVTDAADILQATLVVLQLSGTVEASSATIVVNPTTGAASVTFATNDLNVMDAVTSSVSDTSTFTQEVATQLATTTTVTGTLTTAESTATSVLGGNEVSEVPQDTSGMTATCATATGDNPYTAAETFVSGYVTGQIIEMNYEATSLSLDTNGNTALTVHFDVPLRYATQYEAASFAITWHDRADGNADMTACFTNRGSVGDPYPNCPVPSPWQYTVKSSNQCIADFYASFAWSDIMNGLFRAPQIQDDGTYTEVYFTADIEQWVFFDSSSYHGQYPHLGNPQDGAGQMPKAWGHMSELGQGYSNTYASRSTDFDGRSIHIIDERYTFAQNPFILRFPKTVEVQTSLTVGTKLTMLNAIIKQDIIRIEFNPSQKDSHFAYVDVHVVTEVQHPYGVRTHLDAAHNGLGAAEILLVDGKGNVNVAPEWRDMDDPSSCGAVKSGQVGNQGAICRQEMVFRIKPETCNADSDYKVKLFAKCVDTFYGCPIDHFWFAGTQTERELSNSFLEFDFQVRTGSFCPEVVDEYKLVATPEIWLNERFETMDTGSLHGRDDEIPQGGNVHSNDWVYLKFNYAGYSASWPEGAAAASKSVIDFTRAISVHMDVELPSVPVSQGGNFADSLLPVSLDNDVSAMDYLSVPGSTKYSVKICDTTYTTADYPIRNGDADYQTGELIDCFNDHIYSNAVLYLDVQPIFQLSDPPTVGEKDIAFGFRLDERVIPVDRYNNENSQVSVTVEAEVYWKGNKHPTRRRLQGTTADLSNSDTGPRANNGYHVAKSVFQTRARDTDATFCELPSNLGLAHLDLYVAYKPGHGPASRIVSDYATDFQYQIANQLGMRTIESVNVLEIFESSNPLNFTSAAVYKQDATVRRLQSKMMIETAPTYYNIRFSIATDSLKTAGQSANFLQALLVDRSSSVFSLPVMSGGQVYKLDTDECGEVPVTETATALQSSARPLGSAFVGIFLAISAFLY